MKKPDYSAEYTSDLHEELEAERARWLRRRFLWYTGVSASLRALSAVLSYTMFRPKTDATAQTVRGWWAVRALELLSIALYAGAFIYVKRGGRVRPRELAMRLLVVGGIFLLVSVWFMSRSELPPGIAVEPSQASALGWFGGLFMGHFIACLFMPWTPREAFRPVIPLTGLTVIAAAFFAGSIATAAAQVAFFPLIAAPGILICWWRHSRFRERFSVRTWRQRYGEMRRELSSARQIHESLFPRPIADGPIRLRYVYAPMRQIGGDYLFVHKEPAIGAGRVSLVLIDVTGHGIAAALTVNRLHGELSRVFAEDPRAAPADVLRLLNRYVNLTLAPHSVYASALCLRADPTTDLLEWASGGHPPAFLRAVDGSVEELACTASVLGALADADFDPCQESRRFGPGDAVIAYTDGALEARDHAGRMLGRKGLQRLVGAGSPDADGWPRALLRAVQAHREGPPADDTLIAELSRPLTGTHFRSGLLDWERAGRGEAVTHISAAE